MINFSDNGGFKLCPSSGPTSVVDGRGKPNFPSSTRVKGIKLFVGSTFIISKGPLVVSMTGGEQASGHEVVSGL